MTKNMLRSAVAGVLLASGAFTAYGETPGRPPLMEQINGGTWLDPAEAEQLRDDLYYQRAIYAYMTIRPALNVIGMRDGSEAAFGEGYNVLPIWKDRMDSRAWVPTPNGDVIYSMSYLDLKETGPLVVAAPPKVIGMFTDFFQRTITDVGGIGPDPAPAVALAERTRIYPLYEVEKNVKPMEFPNGSGRRVNMMYPTDNAYWTKLKELVDYTSRLRRSTPSCAACWPRSALLRESPLSRPGSSRSYC